MLKYLNSLFYLALFWVRQIRDFAYYALFLWPTYYFTHSSFKLLFMQSSKLGCLPLWSKRWRQLVGRQ